MAGLVVGAIGIDALRHVKRREELALAALPLVLATHQAIEAFAWWGLEGKVSPTAGSAAVTVYLVIGLVALPALVPYAVMRTEPVESVRRTMAGFVVLGAIVATVVLSGLITNPYGAEVGGRFIDYSTTIAGGGLTTGAYAVAVCAPFLLSSHRRLVIFGAVNIPVVALLAMLLSTGLISLWCVWAAIASVVIARHVRDSSPDRQQLPSRTTSAG